MIGRLFAAFAGPAEEERHEFPQNQRWAQDEHTGFRNNTTTLMRTHETNEVKKFMRKKKHLEMVTDQDAVDSEDLIPNIVGVAEPQNKILYQFEMNPVKKYHEMIEETGEKKEDHKTFFTVDSEDLTQNISEVVEQQNKTSYQIEANIVKKYLEMLEDFDEKKDDHNKMRPSTDEADKIMNDNQSFFCPFDEYVEHGMTEPPDLMEAAVGSNELCWLEPKWLRGHLHVRNRNDGTERLDGRCQQQRAVRA